MHTQFLNQQKGFTLYIVLVLMAIIAILVLAGGQTLNTEMRMSSNDADRKYAFGLAEDALRAGEADVLENIHESVLSHGAITSTLNELQPNPNVFFTTVIGSMFTDNCVDGLCIPAMEEASTDQSGGGSSYDSEPAWERENVFNGDLNAKPYAHNLSNVSQQPRYIVEFLGPTDDASSTLYRVTARAWGKNASTAVTLQSVITVNNR